MKHRANPASRLTAKTVTDDVLVKRRELEGGPCDRSMAVISVNSTDLVPRVTFSGMLPNKLACYDLDRVERRSFHVSTIYVAVYRWVGWREA